MNEMQWNNGELTVAQQHIEQKWECFKQKWFIFDFSLKK